MAMTEASVSAQPEAAKTGSQLEIKNLNAYYGPKLAVRDVTMTIHPNEITALIGPSGCGKSTLLRCLNRMHEAILGARAEGTVLLDGEDIYAQDIDATLVRRRVGMVFQLPTPLRTRSVYENIAIGLRLGGIKNKRTLDEIVERSLRQAALWDEVKDKLQQSGLALSGGQQQRLCIARAIAIEPDVLLMDEPCSALDPVATFRIEELMIELKKQFTIVIVTHNMQQAARVSDRTGVFMVERHDEKSVGELVEYAPTGQIFTTPQDHRTEEYITGRVG